MMKPLSLPSKLDLVPELEKQKEVENNLIEVNSNNWEDEFLNQYYSEIANEKIEMNDIE